MNRSVLVTGTSSGIGRDTALHLASKGFTVYGTVRNPETQRPLEEAARRRNLPLRVLALDVTRPESIARAVKTVLGETGGIYALVNNAGVSLHGYFEDLDPREIRALFDTNLFGTMEMTRAVLPAMREAGAGRIVILTSVGGRIGGAAVSAYCASKFALEGFGESLRQEVMPFGIDIVLVEPGIIKTDIWERNYNVGARATDPGSPYHDWFRNQQKLARRMVESSPNTTAGVARTICKVLTVKRPRIRYLVGPRARIVLGLRRYLPGELFDRLYFRETVRRITSG